MPPFEERTQEKCPIPIISEEIVFKKLAELNVNKAVGVDEVSPHILVNCARTLSKPLKIIFELSLSSGVCPNKWKQANVTPIFIQERLTTRTWKLQTGFSYIYCM